LRYNRAKIVEGRIQKIRDNMALLNQDSLTDPSKKVSELIKESIAAIGENIQVCVWGGTGEPARAVRPTLG
jgi:translation elongation factor EF-Ts